MFDQKQQEELEEFEELQRHRYQTGKRLIYLIVGIDILFGLINFFISHEVSLIKLVIHIALLAALICGVSWVRYLYAAAGILTILSMIASLPALLGTMGVLPVRYIVLFISSAVCTAATTVILLFSRSVKEYMYQRRNGSASGL